MTGGKKTRYHPANLPDNKYVPDIAKIVSNERARFPLRIRTYSTIGPC